MNTQSPQIQLKISLSEQLNELLQSRAARFGLPITQFVKHLIIKEVENEQYPTFQASEWLEKKTEKALKEYGKAINASDFFKQLNES